MSFWYCGSILVLSTRDFRFTKSDHPGNGYWGNTSDYLKNYHTQKDRYQRRSSELARLIRLQRMQCGTLGRGFESHQCIDIYVDQKGLDYLTGYQEVNRCYKRRESEESIVCSRGSTQVRDPLWLSIPGRSHQKSKQGYHWPHKKDLRPPKIIYKQKCIPIGCVPPAAVAAPGGLHQAHPPRIDTPTEIRHPQEQTPPSKHPPSRCPPGTATLPEQTPPLGSSQPPGADTPWEQIPPKQMPPRNSHPPRADTPLGEQPTPGSRHPLGADTPQADAPQEQPPSQSRHPPWGAATPGSSHPREQTPPGSRHPPGADPPVNRFTDACENITLPRLVLLQPATKLRQGNVFTPVCDSVHRRVSVQGSLCPGGSLSRGVSVGESLSTVVSVQGVSVQGVSVWGISVHGGL